MQVLVMFHSRTGATRQLAEAIARGVEKKGVTCVVKPASEVTKEDFVASDGIIAGSPVYFGDLQVIKHPILPGLDRQIQAKHVKTSQIQPRDGWSDDPAGTGGTIISLQLPWGDGGGAQGGI